jgi:glycosyltransferase involved in cell wall biosynthesis
MNGMPDPTPRSAIASSPLSVLLFAHALSTDTTAALEAWRKYLDALHRPYEIMLIQETRSEVSPEPADVTHTFPYDRTAGFRAALNEAIHAAQHPLLAFCPADRQYHPADLERLLKPIDQVDLVVGYRAGGQAPPWRVLLDMALAILSRILLGMPLEKRTSWLGSNGWGRRWVARWIFGIRVTDPECPFRLARREMFEHLPIQSGGPFMQIEVLAKANHLSCYLAEELVTWTPPSMPASDAITFAQDARVVFHAPDFGLPTPLHLTTTPALPDLPANPEP